MSGKKNAYVRVSGGAGGGAAASSLRGLSAGTILTKLFGMLCSSDSRIRLMLAWTSDIFLFPSNSRKISM